MRIHKESPTWFKCLNCLWWANDQLGDKKGHKDCLFSLNTVRQFKINLFGRCPNWTCRRCLKVWDWHENLNHNFCKPKGRANPESKWG